MTLIYKSLLTSVAIRLQMFFLAKIIATTVQSVKVVPINWASIQVLRLEEMHYPLLIDLKRDKATPLVTASLREETPSCGKWFKNSTLPIWHHSQNSKQGCNPERGITVVPSRLVYLVHSLSICMNSRTKLVRLQHLSMATVTMEFKLIHSKYTIKISLPREDDRRQWQENNTITRVIRTLTTTRTLVF